MLIAMEEIDRGTDPMALVGNIFTKFSEMKEEESGIPFKSFVQAPARLKRMGVTFLVTLEKWGKKENEQTRY
jgi:hypothetical protein